MNKKSKEELENLKYNWKKDPCWDIEDTEGFEDYKEELIQFRLFWEKTLKDTYKLDIISYAEKIGIPENLKLAEYIMNLEKHINLLKGE